MSLQMIEQFIAELPNVTTLEHFGYKFYFYGEEQVLPFATIALSDNEHDQVSQLNREGVFRLNIGVSKDTFQQLFPDNNIKWEYSTLNLIMPHPHYAAQHFICILNPEDDKLKMVSDFIKEAYDLAKKRFARKQK